jgi:hypothetical protein
MQSMGQARMHWGPSWIPRHSSHAAATMSWWGSPPRMASVGHSSSQAQQLVQSSVMT